MTRLRRLLAVLRPVPHAPPRGSVGRIDPRILADLMAQPNPVLPRKVVRVMGGNGPQHLDHSTVPAATYDQALQALGRACQARDAAVASEAGWRARALDAEHRNPPTAA